MIALPGMTPLQTEILRLASKDGMCNEARALLMAALGVDTKMKTLPETVAMLQDPTLQGFNLPTAEGKILGEQLVRLSGGCAPDCCTTCAFRLGSVPNQSLTTVAAALDAVMDGSEFLCHQTGLPCKGWEKAAKR